MNNPMIPHNVEVEEKNAIIKVLKERVASLRTVVDQQEVTIKNQKFEISYLERSLAYLDHIR